MCPWVGPHVPSFGRQLWGQPSHVKYLSHRGYCSRESTVRPLTPVARVAGPRCLAGDPLLDCVPARLSLVASMALRDVSHGVRCSLAWLGAAGLGYRPCFWPGWSAGSPQCVRPMGCGLLLPVPRSP